jgi:hypothetical protein
MGPWRTSAACRNVASAVLRNPDEPTGCACRGGGLPRHGTVGGARAYIQHHPMTPTALKYFTAQTLVALFLAGCAGETSDDAGELAAETSSAIIGGQRDTTGSSALLYRRDTRGRVLGLCSAVQIGPKVMLTAAHCVTPSPAPERFSIRFHTGGEVELDRPEDSSSVQVVALAVDPQFRRTNRNLGHDVAILRLGEPGRGVIFGINREPVTSAWFGAKAQLSGYGAPDGTPTGYIPMRRTVEATLNGFQIVGQRSYPSVLRFGKAGTGACTGDDGGPALLRPGSATVVVGLSSFVENRAAPAASCVGESRYARVDESAAFIDSTRAAWGE